MERHKIGIMSSSFLARRIERRSSVVSRSQTLYPKSAGKGSDYDCLAPLRGQSPILHFEKLMRAVDQKLMNDLVWPKLSVN